MKIIILIATFTGTLLLTSCLDEPDCISKTTHFANIKFYKTENNELDTVESATVTIVATGDTLVDGEDITSVQLPLRPDQGSTTFAFASELGIDTLTLSYSINARLISEDCGAETVFSELAYSRSDFDSVSVINHILIEDITEDVKIFN